MKTTLVQTDVLFKVLELALGQRDEYINHVYAYTIATQEEIKSVVEKICEIRNQEISDLVTRLLI